MSTCEILTFNYKAEPTYKDVCVEFDEKIQRKALELMEDYDSLTTAFGVDTPEIFYDHSNGNCCFIFKGNYLDIDCIEDYLKARNLG